MRIAFYGRVSRREQARDTSAAERQQWQLEQVGRSMGVEDPKIYFDIQSGKRDDRPQFQRVLDLIRYKEIDRLVIARADRITRKIETNAKLVELFEETGCELWEIYRGGLIHFENPADWEYFTQAGVASEGETRRLSKRVRDGKAYARFRHKPNARSPFGYTKNPEKTKYIFDDRLYKETGLTAYQVARASIALFLEVRQLRTIVPMLEDRYQWKVTPSGFARWLRNEVLRGNIPFDRRGQGLFAPVQVQTGTHDPMISPEEWEQIYSILERNKRLRGKNQKSRCYPLSGLLYCGHCGQRMTIARSTGRGEKYHYAYCRNRKRLGKIDGWINGVRLPDVEEELIKALCQRSTELAEAIERDSQPEQMNDPEVLRLKQAIANVETMIRANGDGGGFLRQEVIRLENELYKKTNQPREENSELKEKLIKRGQDPNYWRSLPPDMREISYREVAHRIVCRSTGDRTWTITEISLKI